MKKILCLFLLTAALLHKGVNAQVDLRNTGTLYVTGGTDTLYINGGFTNTSAAALTNNGRLYVKQGLTNDQSSLAVGTGTLYLTGSAAQTVSGSQRFNTYDLITNNSAGITLNNDLSVSGVHTFTNGVITTSATPNYMRYEAGSSYTGDADTRHVNGWVKKTGATNFTFPVGNGTVERTINLNTLSASSEFNVKYAINTPNLNQLPITLIAVDTFEFWNVNEVAGGTANVTMNWDNSKATFPSWVVNRIAAASYNGGTWTDEAGTGSGTTAAGSITSNTVSSFSMFTLGYRLFPLPLTLINFSARYLNDHTELRWITAQEQNVSHFTVMRSNDKTNFYPIARVAARNTSFQQNYLTYDNEPINNIAYYRLHSVDIDGRENLSKIVPVKVDAGNRLILLANPVHDRVTLIASKTLNGIFDYTIAAINGQLIQQGKLQIQNGGSYQLELKGTLPPGTYTLNVNNELESFRYKLIVQ